jgi:hypothetical protein
MPLTSKGQKILDKMQKEYGSKKGDSVFYASINKGTISGAEGKKSMKKKAVKKVKKATKKLVKKKLKKGY